MLGFGSTCEAGRETHSAYDPPVMSAIPSDNFCLNQNRDTCIVGRRFLLRLRVPNNLRWVDLFCTSLADADIPPD